MNISICIPTYNQCAYLESAIRSAYNQTRKPNEIIVSNDSSTDDTAELLESLCKEIEILKVINQKENLGITKNTNECFKNASGDLIVRLDSDDIILPTYIERLVEEYLKYEKVGYLHAAVQEINSCGINERKRYLLRDTGYMSGESNLKNSIKGYKVAANIIMFNRQALIEVGYINTDINFAEDYYLSVQISDAGFGNVYVDDILSCYRVWMDNKKVRAKRKITEIEGLKIVFDNALLFAFERRKWDINILQNAKERIAISQIQSLKLNDYNKNEIDEIINALYKLCSTYKVRLYIKLKNSYFSGVLNIIFRVESKSKYIIKNFIKLIYHKKL